MARKLIVEVIGDSRSLERSFARSSKSAKKFQGDITTTGRVTSRAFSGIATAASALGVTLGAAGLIAGIKKSVNAASGLNEEISKTSVIFPESEKAMIAWSKTTANAFGISQREALAASSNIGGLFMQIGQGEKAAAGMSRRFVELAGDLASFFNVSTSDALDKLRSGLAGEAEPLRRFNVFIDEARVKAEAYRSGIAKQGATLTQAQKLQARWNIILKATAPAQGDAARTANTWANVQRRLAAVIDDTSARLGKTLLPVLQKYGNQLVAWLSDAKNVRRLQDGVNDAVRIAADVMRTARDVVQGLVDVLKPLVTQLGGAKDVVKLLVIAFAGMKLGKLITGFQNLGGAATLARGGPRSGLLGLDAAALALGYTLGNLAVKKIPKVEGALRAAGAKVYDFGSAWLENAGLIDSAADKVVAAQARVDKALTERITGFGAREGPEGGFRKVVNAARKAATRATGGAAAGPTARRSLTAAQRNQFFDARIARQLDRLQDLSLRKQLARLKEIAKAIRERLAATTDITRRLTLEDKLLDVARQQRSVQQEITDQIRAGNQALKDRADAIKSAVIERLQRRQTDVLNRRALAEAKEQLRIARQIGGPRGIREARRGLQDVQFDMLRARVERAPATLTGGGRFALAGVVININGVTDPEAVANRVAAVLKRRGKHKTPQTRGATAAA